MKGFNLAFEKEFLLAFFNDPHFLDRFAFLSPDRPSPFLKLEPALFDRIHQLYLEMQKEIGREEDIDQHILMAMLYEILDTIFQSKQTWTAFNQRNAVNRE